MVEIKRNYDSDEFLFQAKENGEITASLYGEISEGVFHIRRYEGDKWLFDGVCRGALNNAEHEGAVSAVIEEGVPDWQLMLFGYTREIDSISGFFEGGACEGCK